MQIGHPLRDLGLVAARELVELALEIARDEDVHGGARREDELAVDDVVDARLDEVRQDAVGIARADDLVDGRANLFGVPAREDVAKVAGRDGDVDGIARLDLAAFDHARVAADVVDDLRKQAPPVDGVGGRERDVVLLEKLTVEGSSSPNMRLTLVWQSSKLPRAAYTQTLSPSCVAICLYWMSLTPPSG